MLKQSLVRVVLAGLLALPLVAGTPTPAYAVVEYGNTPAASRDITAYFTPTGGAWLGSLRTEDHSFASANDATGKADEDWMRIKVTDAQINAGYSYTFEAVSVDAKVDPVIEIYGPNSATPTPVTDLVESTETSGVTQTDPAAIAANDDGPWFDRKSASVSFIPDLGAPGTYYVRVRPYYQFASGSTPGSYLGGTGRYTMRYKFGHVSRLAGDSRIMTAVAISRERFSSSGPLTGAAVLASGYDFPDALAGSVLAGAVGGPMLLTTPSSLPPAVSAELRRLKLTTVFVLGGNAAVSPAVKSAVAALGVRVITLAGSNRTDTARLAALQAAAITPTSRLAFVASSTRFPDALAASPMSTHAVAPILLTAADRLDPLTEAALKDPRLGITEVVIVGGTAVISPAVENRIKQLKGSNHVIRLAGSDRYQTARHVSVWATAAKTNAGYAGTPANPDVVPALDFTRVGIASGEDFPDALAGGVFCGLAGSPILLTPHDRVSSWVIYAYPPGVPPGQDYWYANPLAIVRSYVFGGPTALGNNVLLGVDEFTGP